MTDQEKITNYETLQHIEHVRRFLDVVLIALLKRAENHDVSKLKEPELPIFVEYTSKLAQSTYGSDEYKQFLDEMKPALDHHYAENRHHPEHFQGKDVQETHTLFRCVFCGTQFLAMFPIKTCPQCGHDHFQVTQISLYRTSAIDQMTLIDLIEMLCDWKAATLRHDNGDIQKSLRVNKGRFGISDQLINILQNTVEFLEER